MKNLKKKYFKAFPVYPRNISACHADGEINSGCVWDENRLEDCTYASSGITKDKCPEWHKMEKISYMYTSDEIWKWIENNVTSNQTQQR